MDPYLRFILLFSIVLTGFWIWWRVPNFSQSDEFSRLLDPMKAVGYTVRDPGFESLKRGVTDGRALGATFYLFGIVLGLVFVGIVLGGRVEEFAALGSIESRFELWYSAPAWFWTASILVARLAIVSLAVASIYLMYRIGTTMYNRHVGRWASLLLTISLGFVSIAHEAGEDVPLLFTLLVVIYVAYRYVETGRETYFLIGCGVGGITIAFKLSGGIVVFVLAVAFWLHANRSDDELRTALIRPRLLGFGLGLGMAGIYLGFPDTLFVGPKAIYERITFSYVTASPNETPSGGLLTSAANILSRILHAYLNGFGLSLFFGIIGGIIWGLRSLRDRKGGHEAEIILFTGVTAALIGISQTTVQTHHLIPTYPFLLLLLAAPLAKWYRSDNRGKRIAVVILVLTSSVYVVGGDIQYATEPRDQGTQWLRDHASDGDTMVVYENTIAAVAAPRGIQVHHYDFDESDATGTLVPNETDYTEWMVNTPERGPDYVQITCDDLYAYHPDLKLGGSAHHPERSAYVKDLLDGELGYRVAKRFGRPRPEAVSINRQSLLLVGIVPRATNVRECVWILERDEPG